MATQIEVAQIVAMIGAAYPNFSPTKETIAVYYELLKDLPVDVLKIATKQACAESGRRFAPSVGEIRGMVNELHRQSEGVPTALEAWAELLKAPKSEEINRQTDEKDADGRIIIEVTKYKWSHPLVRQVAVMLGFPKFPDWEQESYERTTFMKAYDIQLQKYLQSGELLPEAKSLIENRSIAYLQTPQPVRMLTDRMTK